MQLYASSLQLISTSNFHAHANVVFHPFVDKWCMLIPFATYLQLFITITSLMNIICNYFIHPFDE
jgi:hypothetical protein